MQHAWLYKYACINIYMHICSNNMLTSAVDIHPLCHSTNKPPEQPCRKKNCLMILDLSCCHMHPRMSWQRKPPQRNGWNHRNCLACW